MKLPTCLGDTHQLAEIIVALSTGQIEEAARVEAADAPAAKRGSYDIKASTTVRGQRSTVGTENAMVHSLNSGSHRLW